MDGWRDGSLNGVISRAPVELIYVRTRGGKRDPRTTSVSNVDEVLRSAEEFVRKNSKEPSRTMNSEECPEGKARGTFGFIILLYSLKDLNVPWA